VLIFDGDAAKAELILPQDIFISVKKSDLPLVLEKTLRDLGGQGTIVDVCRRIWEKHHKDLESSADLFFTWQYDIRWARDKLSKAGVLETITVGRKSIWKLSSVSASSNTPQVQVKASSGKVKNPL
jgi:hypothetical protein